MNILMVTGIFPPDLGGPASYVPRMAEALVRRGHRVEVVCLSEQLMHKDSEYPFAVHRIRRGAFWPLRVLKTVWRIWCSALQCDVVYVNGLGAEAAIAAFASLRPTVHKVVGDYAWERAVGRGWFSGTLEQYQQTRKEWPLRILDWVRSAPLYLAGSIIVPSRYLREKVCGWGVPEQKIRVVYNSVEKSGALPEPAPELPAWHGKTAVTVCRLVEWKGVDELIRAAAQLPQMRLIIVGDGPLRGSLQQLVDEKDLGERVFFLGGIPQRLVRAHMKLGDAFVLNSSYEGLPHVVLEAMAAGVPVIATAAGGTVEVVENNVTGLVVQPGDAPALRKALERLWSEPGLAQRLSKGATAQLGDRFSSEMMVHDTEKILGTTVESSRRIGFFMPERTR